MPVFEYTFGVTACEIHVRAHPDMAGSGTAYIAEAYVWEKEGKALRPVGDKKGEPVLRIRSDPEASRVEMIEYLEIRFGPRGEPPSRHKGTDSVRPILNPPLIDDRPA